MTRSATSADGGAGAGFPDGAASGGDGSVGERCRLAPSQRLSTRPFPFSSSYRQSLIFPATILFVAIHGLVVLNHSFGGYFLQREPWDASHFESTARSRAGGRRQVSVSASRGARGHVIGHYSTEGRKNLLCGVTNIRGGNDSGEEGLPGEDQAALIDAEQALNARDESLVQNMDQQDLQNMKDDFPEEPPPKNRPSVFSYVKIPADDSEPIAEYSMQVPDKELQTYSDIMYAPLRGYFELSPGVDKNQMLRFWGANTATLPQANIMASVTNVEVFWLLLPTQQNNYTNIQIYLDECGKLKNLPANRRALALARVCGRHQDEINGDVFVGRLTREHNPRRGEEQVQDGMYNANFSLADMKRDSPWMREAVRASFEAARRMQEFHSKMREQGVKIVDGNEGNQENSVHKCPHFWWTQNKEEIELNVRKPRDIRKDSIEVVFERERIKLLIDGEEDLSLKLFNKIVPDESTWLISKTIGSSGKEKNKKTDDEGVIQITMVKNVDELWKNLEIGIPMASDYLFQQSSNFARIILTMPKDWPVDERDVVVDTKANSLRVDIKTHQFLLIEELYASIKPADTEWELFDENGELRLSIMLAKLKIGEHWEQIKKPDPNELGNPGENLKSVEAMKKAAAEMKQKMKEVDPVTGLTGEEMRRQLLADTPKELRDAHAKLDKDIAEGKGPTHHSGLKPSEFLPQDNENIDVS